MDNTVPPEHALEEYRTTSENIRHQDQIFFANMTVFITLTGATIAFLFAPDKPVGANWLKLTGIGAGILFTGVFWISSAVYLYRAHHLYRRARTLEQFAPQLKGFRQFSGMSEARWDTPVLSWLRPGSVAWHSLFGSAMMFWLSRASAEFGLKDWVLPTGAFLFAVAGSVAALTYRRLRSRQQASSPVVAT